LYLSFKVFGEYTIHHYSISESGTPNKIGSYSIPYESEFPRIAYNSQLGLLEVVGDYDPESENSYDSNSNRLHFRMNDTGTFSRVISSLWSPVQYGSLVYTKSSGTLCIGGYTTKALYSTQIVTANSDWENQRSHT